MTNSTENLKIPASKLTLLLIGLTAGLIASCFPRLLPYLAEAEQSVTVSLFTLKFIGIATAFSFMIGVSMIWLYMGTKEHTKNLFMSALALPAVLSGGINMASFSAVAEDKISDLNNQTVELQRELEKQTNIAIETLDLNTIQPIALGFSALLGISDAHAQVQGTRDAKLDNSSVRISTESLENNFVIMLGSSNDVEEIKQEENRIRVLGIPNVKAYEIDNKFYLLQTERRTKSRALLDAIQIQKQHGLTPVLIQVDSA